MRLCTVSTVPPFAGHGGIAGARAKASARHGFGVRRAAIPATGSAPVCNRGGTRFLARFL